MIQRKTQTAEYWQSFSLSQDDIDFLQNQMLDAEQPFTTEALAQTLVTERCRREEAQIRAEMARGALYQPRNSFEIGTSLIFPAMDFRAGDVVATRPGENPEHGDFDVITIDYGPDRRRRDFAANLTTPHKLNVEAADLLVAGDLASPERLTATIASHLPGLLEQQMTTHGDFASFENRWLPRALLADVHVGHLNIAEALIELKEAPVETDYLVKEMDLPEEITPSIRTFSLHSALANDDRFDQVGPADNYQWYLRRLEPPEALETPVPLRYEQIPFDRDALSLDLLQLEWELDDEWSANQPETLESERASAPLATVLLTYPHRVSGTLPLNNHSRPFFPAGRGQRTMVTLIDGRWGQRFTAWIVREGRYVAGLRSWFEQHKLPAGALITLQRSEDSGEVVIDFRPKRMRREWARWAQVLDADHLDIQLRKQEVACEYDDLVIIGDDGSDALLKLRATEPYAEMPLSDLVFQIFSDLAGQSQQGQVHAKTIYSTMNLLRRCPPGPIFAALEADDRLESVGDNLYRLAVES